MKKGDLVKKTKGYGANSEFPLIGVVVEFLPKSFKVKFEGKKITKSKVLVLTEGGLEKWITQFVEVI